MITNIPHKSALIKCPHCGAEYLPGEIYMPNSIIYEDYYTADREPNLVESFVCEYCNKPFVITATVSYKTTVEAPEKDFSSPYVLLID